MKTLLTLLAMLIAVNYSYAQTQIITTGNNVINPSNPLAADIVIGSDANSGIRHDGSIMWWCGNSASRISNIGDVFYLSQWSTTIPNVSLNAAVGGASYFKGNLGVGLTNPGYTLDVKKNDNSGSPILRLGVVTDGYGFTFSRNQATGHLDFACENPGVAGYSFDGNIGIGTTTPDAKLAVNGTIHCREVKVDLANWPDYIFKPTYQLNPLSEVKAYIAQNQHLPEMPSAAEVEKEGVNLGEMNKLLVKKVEELTLYLIEQNRKLEDNKQENTILKRQVEALAKEIHKN